MEARYQSNHRQEDSVSFNCDFSSKEIEVTLLALTTFVTSGMCPDGLKKELMSVTEAFYKVQRTGSAL